MKRIVSLLLLLASATASLRADLQVRITNQLSESGPVPNSLPANGATAGQFSSAATTSGGSAAASSSNGSMILQRGTVGPSFASGVPDFGFGDIITPPNNHPTITKWRAAPVAPGEVIQTISANETPVPTGTTLRYYYSEHSERVYASEPGEVAVVWRSELADASGNYTLEFRTYIISIVPRVPVRRIFWTERPFSGPQVAIPPGVEDVVIVYRERFADTDGPNTVNGETNGAPRENRTFWRDDSTGFLRAQILEGRVLVELLGALNDSSGSRESLGIEVVDVLSEPVPGNTAFTVDTHLGERLLPSDGDSALQSNVITGLTSTPAVIANRPIDGESAYYAEGTTTNPNEVIIYWSNIGHGGVAWPRFRNNYNLIWPSDLGDFVLNALPLDGDDTETPVELFSSNTPTLVFQDTYGEALLDETNRFSASPGPDGTNRTLLLMQVNGRFWYVRVFSARQDKFDTFPHPDLNNQPLNGAFSQSIAVGERLQVPEGFGDDLSRAGYILETDGTSFHPGAYVDPLASGFPTAELQSEIIPVNKRTDNDQLTVWWYRKVAPPTVDFEPLHWPSVVGTYNIVWPTNPREIVIASNEGTGELTSEEAVGSIYVQNDPESVGYNPNEEHALMLEKRGYALRDDLNIANVSSEPYVLIDYIDAEDARVGVSVFKVLRENVEHTFEYDAVAGSLLGAPRPLTFLPVPLIDDGAGNLISALREVTGETVDPDASDLTPSRYDRFTFEDRNNQTWVYRGPHDGGTPQLEMQYYYATQPGFAIPDATTGVDQALAAGSIEPFLRTSTGPGTWSDVPITVKFTPRWPDDIPETPDSPNLEFGETLTKAKNGLPDVINQTSLEIVYQQSLAKDVNGNTDSVILFDPTRAKIFLLGGPLGAGLNRVPVTAATDSRNGKTYFQKLPPHLKERFFFDPAQGQFGGLVLQGEFVDDIIDPDYLLLNTLSDSDIIAVQELVAGNDSDKGLWDAAVSNLSTDVETFVETLTGIYEPDGSRETYDSDELPEILDDDQAVDSYALTPMGDGQGYVTLISGNGEAFTPERNLSRCISSALPHR